MIMLTKAFWKGAAERALKTFIQSFIAAMVIAVGAATTAWEVGWLQALYAALGVALLATFGSLATSLGNAGFTAGAPAPAGGGDEFIGFHDEPHDSTP